jgi:hypothetical protein
VDEVHDDFAVTLTSLIPAAKRAMIVDFTVTHKHTIGSDKWLHTGGTQIIDREAIEIHATLPHRFRAIVVGATVAEEIGRNISLLTKDGDNTTHFGLHYISLYF